MQRGFLKRVRLLSSAVLLMLTACVPLSGYDIDGAPCPCPSGYLCCSGACQKNALVCMDTDTATDTDTDTADSETSTAPASCETNDNCQGGEVCLSWRDNEDQLQGPRVCRPTCFSSDECNEWEVCELSLSDGRPMGERRLSLACLDASGFDGCAPSSCRACVSGFEGSDTDILSDMSIPKKMCSETADRLLGCFAAIDEKCGLYCTIETLIDCECAMSDGNAQCLEPIDANPSDVWCVNYPCDQCQADPGGTSCVDSAKNVCLSVALTDDICDGECACNAICVEQQIGACK